MNGWARINMSCIGFPRKANPGLHDLLAKKLIEPGWAGQANEAEAKYIAKKLSEDPGLRRRWDIKHFTRRRRIITPEIARRLVLWWNTHDVQLPLV